METHLTMPEGDFQIEACEVIVKPVGLCCLEHMLEFLEFAVLMKF